MGIEGLEQYKSIICPLSCYNPSVLLPDGGGRGSEFVVLPSEELLSSASIRSLARTTLDCR
jgi:hypothetical protein